MPEEIVARILRLPGYGVAGWEADEAANTLTLAMASGASLLEASLLANQAAGLVVGKLGTAVVAPEELVQAFEMPAGRDPSAGKVV